MPTSPSTKLNPNSTDFAAAEYATLQSLADGSFAQMTTTAGSWGYAAISTATSTQVKTGAGQFHALFIFAGTLGNITAYDGTSTSGAVILPTFTAPTLAGSGFVATVDVSFSLGLFIVTATAMQILVTYR